MLFYLILLKISAKFVFIKKKTLYLNNSIKIQLGHKNSKYTTLLKIFLPTKYESINSKYYSVIY